MLGAAPRVRRFRAVAFVVMVCVVLVPLASGAVTESAGGAASGQGLGLWAVQLPAAKSTGLSAGLFTQLRRGGVSALVVQRSGWLLAAHKQLVGLATLSKTRLVEPVVAPKTQAQQALLRAR